jgi:hypothetical protein
MKRNPAIRMAKAIVVHLALISATLSVRADVRLPAIKVAGLPPSRLQGSGQDLREAPRALRHTGRGDPGGKTAVPRVQSVAVLVFGHQTATTNSGTS